MSNNPASPLLGGNDRDHETDAAEQNGQKPDIERQTKYPKKTKPSDESTPLLSREPDGDDGNDNAGEDEGPDTDFLPPVHTDSSTKKQRRWRLPTIISICVLMLLLIAILAFGFALPTVVEEYANQAAVFEPTDLSIAAITSTGVKARVKGDFVLDASRVQRKPVRDLGRFGTWVARAIEATPNDVQVFLPERGGKIMGTAQLPPVVVWIRDGQVNHLDIVAEIEPGEVDDLLQVAKDWIDGRLSELRVRGQSDVALKSGIFYLGTQTISRDMLFKAGASLPSMPQYNISRFNIHEVDFPDGGTGIAIDALATVFNDYPLTFTVPPLAFEILVPGCMQEPSILVANATTEEFRVVAKQDVTVAAQGLIRNLPENLVTLCPDSMKSPLDELLQQYMNGDKTTFFVRGAEIPVDNTPTWIAEALREMTVPFSISGHSFKNLIRSFNMSDVHFSLPNPLADPDTPEAQPRISAAIKVIANLPEEMNFPVNVPRVRADADVYYKEQKLGILDLHKWQNSSSERIEARDGSPPGIIIRTDVEDAPLYITDSSVFQEVVSAMLWGKEKVVLGVQARVDIETSSALGKFAVRDIPASGKVPIQPPSNHGFKSFAPKIGSLKLLETTPSAVFLSLLVNITNPTNYSATVPFVDIRIHVNDTLVGHASAKAVDVGPGFNENIPIEAEWNPEGLSGEKGGTVGRNFISQYISGYNTSLTLRTHNGTIPSVPVLGHALSNFSVDIPTPRLKPPKNPNRPDDDPENDRPRFIDDATMHLWSSTATFTLLSPLHNETLYISFINATALYNHTEPVGKIFYDLPFAVPPGATTTPNLPVDWSLGSVGYDAIKQALGGTLKLDARANAGIRVGQWEQEVWFVGRGIGAHVRI